MPAWLCGWESVLCKQCSDVLPKPAEDSELWGDLEHGGAQAAVNETYRLGAGRGNAGSSLQVWATPGGSGQGSPAQPADRSEFLEEEGAAGLLGTWSSWRPTALGLALLGG